MLGRVRRFRGVPASRGAYFYGPLAGAFLGVVEIHILGLRRPMGETKPGSDFKYDTFMGFGVPSTIVKDRVRRTYEKKMWWLLHLAEM